MTITSLSSALFPSFSPRLTTKVLSRQIRAAQTAAWPRPAATPRGLWVLRGGCCWVGSTGPSPGCEFPANTKLAAMTSPAAVKCTSPCPAHSRSDHKRITPRLPQRTQKVRDKICDPDLQGQRQSLKRQFVFGKSRSAGLARAEELGGLMQVLMDLEGSSPLLLPRKSQPVTAASE